jgi:hypothetical protein
MITSLILAGRSTRVTSESVMSGVKPAATAPAATDIEIPSAPPAVEKERQTGTEEKTKATPPAGSPAAKEQPSASGAEKTN